jgi:Cd2+/Zn2+-exporting ATPase
MLNRVTYRVRGLDCAEEVDALRKELGGKPGISALDFDILNAKVTVTYEPAAIDSQAIVAAVASTGMKAVPWAEAEAGERSRSLRQDRGPLILTCASGVFLLGGFISHSLIHGALHALVAGGEEHVLPPVSVLLYLSSIVTGAWFVFPKALLAARRLRPDMNLLMTIAIVAAAAIGELLEAATVAFLFALALLLERWSIAHARRAVTVLMNLSPATARCLSPDDGTAVEKRVEDVPVGAIVSVRPGEKIPLDGEVTRGRSTVNQAPITGESAPVAKAPGDEVFAGTINQDGALEFRVTKPASDTTLARVIHLVQEAHSRRAPTERWVDRFAHYYTPVMVGVAVCMVLVPPIFLSGEWTRWLYRGLVVLVIACPCALVISTPVSIVSGLTSAARRGVLIKGGLFLEAPARVQALALDKTGTITYGRPEAHEVVPFHGYSRRELLQIAATLEAQSEHPFAIAILRKAREEGIVPGSPEDFQATKGKGARARIHGRPFWIGSHLLMHEVGGETPEVHDTAEKLQKSGYSVVAVGNDEQICGLIAVADAIRKEAPEALRQIKQLGVRRIVMLTGDNEGTARVVAGCIGVDDFRAELLPEQKVEVVRTLVGDLGTVAMVGDGVNDAPAMAAATFGIAMGAAGTDVAIETADIALMSDDLTRLPWLIMHSRHTLRTIKQNIAFALGVKLLFLALAAFGLATLWMAIAADMGASLLVISNGMRLLGSRCCEWH